MSGKVFAPEKVRELYNNLHYCRKDGELNVFLKWLEQNPIEPVVVGLNDEQVKDFSRLYGLTATQQNRLNANLTDFLRTQTFSQVRAFDDSELSEKYMNLYDDYQSILIDKANTSQFEPNWDDAPKNAVEFRLDGNWYNSRNDRVGWYHVLKIERPKTAPVVEVGHVWRDKKEFDEIIIIALGKNKIYETICYQFTESRVIEIRCNDDFLAKFERVE